MELSPDKFKMMLPLPTVVITTVDAAGVPNAAPYGCVMPILRPLDLIVLASAPPRHTLANIRETKEFVVNVMGRPSFDRAMRTAKNYPPEVDELEAVGLTTDPSRRVKPPRISDALGWIEAVLEREITDERYALTIGKVVFAEISDEFAVDASLSESPVMMLTPFYRILGDTVGDVRETMKLFLTDESTGFDR
jgi:flavin reductase (DIM6/NTAB) family NADH-FMN oxidoreductase RutF